MEKIIPEQTHKVYIKVNENNDIIAINSEIFLSDVTDWILIDEGSGMKYSHAQTCYLPKSLYRGITGYNYQYLNGKIIEKVE